MYQHMARITKCHQIIWMSISSVLIYMMNMNIFMLSTLPTQFNFVTCHAAILKSFMRRLVNPATVSYARNLLTLKSMATAIRTSYSRLRKNLFAYRTWTRNSYSLPIRITGTKHIRLPWSTGISHSLPFTQTTPCTKFSTTMFNTRRRLLEFYSTLQAFAHYTSTAIKTCSNSFSIHSEIIAYIGYL